MYNPLRVIYCAQSLSHVQVIVIPWTVACQIPLSMEFSRWEYWNGLRFLLQENLPNPGIKSVSAALAGRPFTTATTWEVAWSKCSFGFFKTSYRKTEQIFWPTWWKKHARHLLINSFLLCFWVSPTSWIIFMLPLTRSTPLFPT